jgi:hypothetical protein
MQILRGSIAALVLAAGIVLPATAVAQSSPAPGSPGRPPGTSGIAPPTTKEAPVGHRQPRAGDVPDPDIAAPHGGRDKEIDRVLNSICRGC